MPEPEPDRPPRVRCPGASYVISREVCLDRQVRGYFKCPRCPERGGQLYLWRSPREVDPGQEFRRD